MRRNFTSGKISWLLIGGRRPMCCLFQPAFGYCAPEVCVPECHFPGTGFFPEKMGNSQSPAFKTGPIVFWNKTLDQRFGANPKKLVFCKVLQQISFFSPFFQLLSTKNIENTHFNQRLECAAIRVHSTQTLQEIYNTREHQKEGPNPEKTQNSTLQHLKECPKPFSANLLQ